MLGPRTDGAAHERGREGGGSAHASTGDADAAVEHGKSAGDERAGCHGDGSADDGSDDEGDDAGTPGSVGGDLYEGSGDTVGSVFSGYIDRVSDAPIMAAAGDFFSVPNGGGSCPTWTTSESEWLPALTFDFFCDPALDAMLEVAGLLILAVAAYCAFNIAVGD